MENTELPWSDAKAMLKEVDKLLKGSPWLHRTLHIPAEMDGSGAIREIELLYRNPVHLIEELIGNPDFNNPDLMVYEPHEVWIDSEGPDGEKQREYTEA